MRINGHYSFNGDGCLNCLFYSVCREGGVYTFLTKMIILYQKEGKKFQLSNEYKRYIESLSLMLKF